MSTLTTPKDLDNRRSLMPDEATFQQRLAARHRKGLLWQTFYYVSIGVAILALITLFANVINEAFGSIAIINEIEPETLTPDGAELGTLDEEQLAQILVDNLGNRVVVLIRDQISAAPTDTFTSAPLSQVFPGGTFPEGFEDATIADVRALEGDEQLQTWRDILVLNLNRERMLGLVESEVVGRQIVASYPLLDAIFNYDLSESERERLAELPALIAQAESELEAFTAEDGPITQAQAQLREARQADASEARIAELRDAVAARQAEAEQLEEALDELMREQASIINRSVVSRIEAQYPNAEITRFYSWLNGRFLTTPMSAIPAEAGIRTAILGSVWLMFVVILFALPVGVATAIYLNEYATDNWFNRVIETNVRNLAGVPSIIYGMLGLAVFVRIFEPLTQGRTILSAALTLGLLVLPIIIINAQEALRAVPQTLREASFGMGATQWQTIWKVVLPTAMPGILTGLILSVSRAVGETAPLIVVGAATLIFSDPSGVLSNFTALPIQIYQWTARPQDQFRDIAASAIIVLLITVILLNATAIILRNRYGKQARL